jgi:hypothetical protein
MIAGFCRMFTKVAQRRCSNDSMVPSLMSMEFQDQFGLVFGFGESCSSSCLSFLWFFFGVGLVRSTQVFPTYFVKQYFVIAAAWSLSSGGILAWYIRLFGGTKTEAAAGFLAFMGLWLVGMQVIPNPLVQESWNLSR